MVAERRYMNCKICECRRASAIFVSNRNKSKTSNIDCTSMRVAACWRWWMFTFRTHADHLCPYDRRITIANWHSAGMLLFFWLLSALCFPFSIFAACWSPCECIEFMIFCHLCIALPTGQTDPNNNKPCRNAHGFCLTRTMLAVEHCRHIHICVRIVRRILHVIHTHSHTIAAVARTTSYGHLRRVQAKCFFPLKLSIIYDNRPVFHLYTYTTILFSVANVVHAKV